MIARREENFAIGCGRRERFATSDCSTRPWRNGGFEKQEPNTSHADMIRFTDNVQVLTIERAMER